MKDQDKKNTHSGAWLEFSRRDYAEMTELQEALCSKRQQGLIPDVVILLEHSPCFTVGRSGGHHNILVNNKILEKQGITIHDTMRGGNITYHGPGQLVCYPILSLKGENRDLHAHARKMEEVMIRTIGEFGIVGDRKPKYPGVWVGDQKIGAMGIAVRKWTTMHGIALNVCPDLEHFSYIVPCGITAHGVTSMAQILGHPIDIDSVRNKMRKNFSDIFQISLSPANLEHLIKENCREQA
ncbi:lipoyl(octanoyl) transferase LipB [Maridesulfovibrio zosterae]|uniref:lipoyl(octanoyl) transferase LipB n=1 Tax=Maridesulfovibrio zosterae TaxID=82171 RepID=UPI0004094857|nr:lipoyl(octanoyl) transferase LipB [Maridesulfovibrio zosterae]